jgi:WG containing repeat
MHNWWEDTDRMKCWLLLGSLTIATLANAQRPQIFPDCESGTLIPFNDGGNWGYLTVSGIAIPPHFKSALPFSGGLAIACTVKGCVVINTKGQFVSPVLDPNTSLLADRYTDGIGVVAKDGKWGYADLAGNVVIPLRFDFAGDFEKGVARVSQAGKYFFINRNGERITPEFDGAFDFSEDLAAVVVDDKIGYIRRDGTFALPPAHQGASGIDFSEGLVAVRIEGKVGFMDTTGSIIVKPSYDDAYPFSDGLAPVNAGGKWGYIDKKGDLVFPLQYRTAHMFAEGIASVQLTDSGKWGYIDKNGGFALSPVYDSAMPFCAGVAQVESFHPMGVDSSLCRSQRYKGKHGIIDHSGNYIWRDSKEQIWNSPVCY